MGKLSTKVSAVSWRIRSLGRTGRWVAAGLAGTVVIGLIWLVADWSGGHGLADNSTEQAPVGAPSQLHPHVQSRPFANNASDEQENKDPLAVLRQMAGEPDIWRTSKQSAMRWQAAKMTALGCLIEKFPSIRSAAVLYEAQDRGGLGQQSGKSTAAVQVELADGAEMTPNLVSAIIDLVCGSIAGLEKNNVRVIDSAGGSYRPDSPELVYAKALAEQRSEEEHYVRKIRQALSYIDGLIIDVRVEPNDGGQYNLIAAGVCVPRSYFASVLDCTDDAALDTAIAGHLPKIRRQLARVLGTTDKSALEVDWYYDRLTGGSGRSANVASPARPIASKKQSVFVLSACGLVLAAGCGYAWRRIRRLRRRRRLARLAMKRQALAQRRVLADQQEPAGFFARLADLDNAQIAGLLMDEHPQTGAVVLARLDEQRSANILAGIDEPLRAQILNRLRTIVQLDAEVIEDIEHGLAERLGRLNLHGGEEVIFAWKSSRDLDSLTIAFDEISSLSPGRLRQILEKLTTQELAIAFQTAGRDLKHKLLLALDPSSRAQVCRQMKKTGPVRLGDVEAAWYRLLRAAYRLRHGSYVGNPAAVDSDVVA